MKLILMMVMCAATSANIIFDFDKQSSTKDWVIVDDVVMGGKSSGSFKINHEGHGIFEGAISLANNGGFSSVRYGLNKKSVKEFKSIILKIKGDAKKYQFRIKSNSSDYYSYVATFTTNGQWQEIEIPMSSMSPYFRGRKLDKPNFSGDRIEQIAFLIGNKKQENFRLLIDKITLK